jgi:hypothetical protein
MEENVGGAREPYSDDPSTSLLLRRIFTVKVAVLGQRFPFN